MVAKAEGHPWCVHHVDRQVRGALTLSVALICFPMYFNPPSFILLILGPGGDVFEERTTQHLPDSIRHVLLRETYPVCGATSTITHRGTNSHDNLVSFISGEALQNL